MARKSKRFKKNLLEDILLDELQEDSFIIPDKILNESFIPISPLLAFLTFKKNVFNYLKNNKLFLAVKKGAKDFVKGAASAVGATAEMKEKIASELGTTSGKGGDASVYSFNREQLDFLAELASKYGDELVDEIRDFRRDVLAPYQVLKRVIKRNYRITPKETLGMTRQEFLAALESGRKKIEKRGQDFNERHDSLKGKGSDLKSEIAKKEAILKHIEDGNTPKEEHIRDLLEKRFAQERDTVLGDSQFSFYELERLFDLLEKTKKQLKSELNKGDKANHDRVNKLYQKIDDINDGKIEMKQFSGETLHSKPIEGLKEVFAKYIKRRNTLGNEDLYKNKAVIDEYKKQLEDEIEELKSKKGENVVQMVRGKNALEFNDNEAKIWKLKDPTRSEYSGRLSDFYQAIKIEDFDNVGVKYLQKDEEIIKAEKAIEAEIKAFERKIEKIITAEDLKKLKEMRLISNIITVKEMKDPKNLFKSSEEIAKMGAVAGAAGEASDSTSANQDDEEEGSVNKERILGRFREIATMEFDSQHELDKAKREAKTIMDKLEYTDKKVYNSLESIYDKIKSRTKLEADSHLANNLEADIGDLIDINQIENMTRKILGKEYTSADTLKQDLMRLNKFIEKYKEQDPKNAERNLAEISFLLDRARKKTTMEISLGKKEEEDEDDDD